jgi:predicted oxidoreductase
MVAIIGSQSADRLSAAAAAKNVTLTRADVYSLIEACEGIALP